MRLNPISNFGMRPRIRRLQAVDNALHYPVVGPLRTYDNVLTHNPANSLMKFVTGYVVKVGFILGQG